MDLHMNIVRLASEASVVCQAFTSQTFKLRLQQLSAYVHTICVYTHSHARHRAWAQMELAAPGSCASLH